MDPRLVRLVLKSMSPDAFEELVFALVLVEEPSARRLMPSDVGRDIVVEGPAGELAWQAKHHVSGIDWSKCRESLAKAVEHRDPKQVTFVFPLDLTGSKEPGLKGLRKDFPNVEIPEPWGASTLVEKLRANPEIRRHHIDRVIGVDHQFAQESWARGAALKEAGTCKRKPRSKVHSRYSSSPTRRPRRRLQWRPATGLEHLSCSR